MTTMIGEMRSVFLDIGLDFDTPLQAWESEELLLRELALVAWLNLCHLRRNPNLPKIYSKEAGIVWSPPDQMRGWRIDTDKIPKVQACLRSVGADEEAIVNVLRMLSGMEIFQDIKQLLKKKHGDCDRLSCARLGELWHAGIMAGPYLVPYPNDSGGTTYHAGIIHIDGSFEDPSVICGMGGESRAQDRVEEIRKCHERHRNLVTAVSTVYLTSGGEGEEALGAVIDRAGYVPRGGFARFGRAA